MEQRNVFDACFLYCGGMCNVFFSLCRRRDIKSGKYSTGKYYLWAVIHIKMLKAEFKIERNFHSRGVQSVWSILENMK